VERLLAREVELASFGLAIESFGPGAIAVRETPSLLGKIDEKLRLPMVPVSEPTRVAVRSAMVHAGLIN